MTTHDDRILQLLVDLACSLSKADGAQLVVHGQPEVRVSSGDVVSHEPADVSEPFSGRAAVYFDDDSLTGSVAAVPVTGPSAESGWLTACSNQNGQLNGASAEALVQVATLIEDRLDRTAEQIRLDQLGETLQQNQEHLQAARDRLSVSNQELEQFAYIAAHELVAPLRAVAVYAEVLGAAVPADDSEESERAQHCAAEIRSGVSLMDQQVQYLLELSRTQANASTAEAVELQDVLSAALETLAGELSEIDAVIEVDELPVVSARFVPMQSVFANLLSNAIRYRDPDRPLKVRVSARPVDGGWRVSVLDNGTGVDAPDRVRVFQLFERGSSSVEGSGIGLGLSRRIVEAFGGSMGIDPAPIGSDFWVWMPSGDPTVTEPTAS